MCNFENLEIYKRIKNKELKTNILSLIRDVKDIINGISGCFPNFTMHNLGHCYRVAQNMEDIIFNKNSKKVIFSDLELAMMIFVAVLHDVGMYFSEENYNDIINGKEDIDDFLTFDGINKVINNERESVKEFVRLNHHNRVSKIINTDKNGFKLKYYLRINNIDFSDEIIKVCKAHGENFDYLKNLPKLSYKSDYKFNLQFIAVLLRISDLVDIDNRRVPIVWYNINKPKGFSEIEWQKHFIIEGNKRIEEYKEKKQIVFYGSCCDPIVYRSYLNLISYIEIELRNLDDWFCRERANDYNINIDTKVINNVEPIDFKYVDLRLNLNYNNITKLLMGENLYQNKIFGLRELIQNSIDSCHLMEEKYKKYYNNNFDKYISCISINISKEKNYVKIIDNGTGMSMNIIKNYFLNVGVSYYQSKEYEYENNKYKAIGKFGIGFLSSFLLSHKVEVTTSHYLDSNKSILIQLDKLSEYVVISEKKSEYDLRHFTEIKLLYEDFFNVFKGGIDEVQTFITKNFYSDISFYVVDDDVKSKLIINKQSVKDRTVDAVSGSIDTFGAKWIECDKYSKILNGCLLMGWGDSNFNIVKLDENENVCIYNVKSKKLDIVPFYEIEDGEYRLLFYLQNLQAAIDKDLKINELEYTIYKDIINKIQFKRVFVPINVPFTEKKDVFYINGISLGELFKDAFSTPDFQGDKCTLCYGCKNIYKKHNELLLFKGLSTSHYLINLNYSEFLKDYSTTLSVYYKQIYITELDFNINLPIKIIILDSNINCDIDDKIQLNVSRDRLINGSSDIYEKEIERIILRILQKNSKCHKSIICEYIDYKLNKT